MQLITTNSLTFATHIRFEKIKKRIQVYLFFDKQVVWYDDLLEIIPEITDKNYGTGKYGI